MRNIVKAAGRLLAAAALCCACGVAWAQASDVQNSIEYLQVSQQGGSTIVKLTMRQPLAAAPASFSIANPARVAFDFAATANGLGRSSQQVNDGGLRSVNVVQVGDRTRMVMNLLRNMPFETRIVGNTFLIVFATQAPGDARADASPVTHFAQAAPQSSAPSIRDVNFRRGKNGEGLVVVDLSEANVGIDIRQQGTSLIVDFAKTALPENLRRRLDVTDFATPITGVNTFSQGDNTRIVITPRGTWEHNAYQSDNQFVVEVKELVEDPNKLVQGTRGGYQGEKLSLNFQNVEVRSVLQVISDFTNLNVVVSDSVTGALTLRLKDVPWDQALDIILNTRGLDMRKNGNVIWIAPRDELAAKEKLSLEAKQQISNLEQPQSETFALSYQKAADLKGMLTGNLLSKDGAIIADPVTNTLFIKDTPSRLQGIRDFIQQVDVKGRQVLIEARIVFASETFGQSLGVRLGYNDLSSTIPGNGVGTRVLGTQTYATVSPSIQNNFLLTGQTVGGGVALGTAPALSNMVNLPATGQGGAVASSIAISLFNSSLSKFVNLELSAAETDGRVKSISSPRVLTADKIKAVIEQGQEVPYQQATASGATAVAFVKANLKLEVTPQISPTGAVILELEVNNDTVGNALSSGAIPINTKHVKTKVTVENGGTLVLGGIYQQDETKTTNKVPLLGDIPYLGNLFKNNTLSNSTTELMIFITPRIVDEQLGAATR